MNTSEKTDMIAASLFAVHRDLTNPTKNAKASVKMKTGGTYSYAYMDLPALVEHCKKVLTAAQVFVMQDVKGGAGFVEVYTTFMHFSGQYIELGPLFMPAAGDAQAYGSATSYARRYALAAALNLAPDEDDDGKRASNYQGSPARTATSPAQSATPDREDWGAGATSPPPGAATALLSEVAPPQDSVSAAPDLGEGDGAAPATLDGTDELATDIQWDNLLKLTQGNKNRAVTKINKSNKSAYTYASAREGASWAELVKAMEA
jgi:hypothetical protein